MEEFICSVCGFIYDEESAEHNVEGNIIQFADIPGDWTCPNCGVSPDMFISRDEYDSLSEEQGRE